MKLRYTPVAAAELDEILAFIHERSRTGAGRIQARIEAVTTLLLAHPNAGTLTSNARLRRIAATPYPFLIFYEPMQDEIVIVGIRHAARTLRSMPSENDPGAI